MGEQVSLDRKILARADIAPEQVALRFEVEPGAAREGWTYADLADRVDGMEAELRAVAGGGASVAIIMAPHGESVAALLAAFRVGSPSILIPVSLPRRELAGVLALSHAAALFTPPGATPAGWQRLATGRRTNERLHSTEAAIGQLTSGSTGSSRLALRNHVALRTEITSVAQRLALSPQDHVVCLSSLAHSYGLLGGLLAPLAAGAAITLASRPADLAAFRDTPPTIVFGLGATYSALLAAAEAPDLTRIRSLLSAGAPLEPGLFLAFQRHFGLPIRQDYGTTETGTISLDTANPAAPQTVGLPLLHVEVQTAPVDAPLEAGETGEIQVRSVAVASGYLTQGGLQPCTDLDGWYRTRDLGAFDAAGRLVVGRRLRDQIIVPGVRVRPEAVEAVLASLPGVRECVVVPGPGADGRPGLRAIVVAPGLSEAAIRSWLGHHLPDLVPWTEIKLLAALPRSPAGKILQKYLV